MIHDPEIREESWCVWISLFQLAIPRSGGKWARPAVTPYRAWN